MKDPELDKFVSFSSVNLSLTVYFSDPDRDPQKAEENFFPLYTLISFTSK